MFKTRLQLLLSAFIGCWLVLVVRLLWVQVIAAEAFRQAAQDQLVLATQSLPPMRGRILDRTGRILATDEPAWSIAVHYRLLTGDPAYRAILTSALARRFDMPDDERSAAAAEVDRRVAFLWTWLSAISGESLMDLDDRCAAIVARVSRWKAACRPASAVRWTIKEETECHALVHGLTHAERVATQVELGEALGFLQDVGAVALIDEARRTYDGATTVAHLVGVLGEVDDGDVARRPYQPDPSRDLGGYRIGDLAGQSGVERLAEDRLRGRRGLLTRFHDERPDERVEPVHGRDVVLTVDLALQDRLYDTLREHVDTLPDVPGGSIVVLDVATREALAMVSYPSYDPNDYRRDFSELSQDYIHRPLQGRAFYCQYAPGSIVKPVTLIAALSSGLIDDHTQFTCNGRLFADKETPGCWRSAGTRARQRHGAITAEEAITRSCNIFCFQVGHTFCDTMGPRRAVDRMTEWLGVFGMGRPSGMGLPEERTGAAPDSAVLSTTRGRAAGRGDTRNFAIGQGELLITPVQAANLVATYANGRTQPVQLLRDPEPPPAWEPPVRAATWALIRRGMYGVVNDSAGTARGARLQRDDFVLCGKSGSAQSGPWRTAYDVTAIVGGQEVRERVPGTLRSEARDHFAAAHRRAGPIHYTSIEVAATWPTSTDPDVIRRYSHAWFVAFVQPAHGGVPDWNQPAPLAIAVMLEFGGSGGTVTGPLCRDVARVLLDEFPHYTESSPAFTVR